MAKRKTSPPISRQSANKALDACACCHFRMASRSLTRAFDEALQPIGLRSTQLAILLGIVAHQSPTIASLARELVLDASTLNRNLQPLVKKQLIRCRPAGPGPRKVKLSLTAKGHQAVGRAVPIWSKMQSQLAGQLGPQRFADLRADMKAVVQAVRELTAD